MTAVAEPIQTATESPAAITAPAAAEGSTRPSEKDQRERAMIDASARGPVITFFSTALFWLLVSCMFGHYALCRMVEPTATPWFLELLATIWNTVIGTLTGIAGGQQYVKWEISDSPILTYGRLWPAFTTSLIYGWASLAGLGVATWLMGRLARVSIKLPGLVQLGAWTWNAGVLVSVVSILGGYNTGLEYFEMHRGGRLLLFVGYILIAVWGIILFRYRRDPQPYISVWYLVSAFFLFPWYFGTADALGGMPEIRGVMQNLVNAWYVNGLFLFWIGGIGLAAAYYLIPKVINRPVHSYPLASIGFWTYLVFGGLQAGTRLNGGPIPAWIITIGIAASILSLVPLVCVATNLLQTLNSRGDYVAKSPTVRFTAVGVFAFVIAGALAVITSLRSIDALTHHTPFRSGQMLLLLLGFFTMVMFGAMYYIMPRLMGCEWLSRRLIRWHFLSTAYGAGLLVVLMICAGLSLGFALNDPEVPGSSIPALSTPFLPLTSLGWLFFTVGSVIFTGHYILMRLRIGQPAGEPTLFKTHTEGGH
jgi:cytochrome c oxidase cbb3-type subunit 1